MRVSVIIPVYCVEQYITDCVNSILTQNYIDVEVILVDDGSPDNCGKICDDFAARDKRCKVIHKANGGLSDARNVGVSAANGDFVLFLDGDDLWSDPDALSRLMERQRLTNASVLNFSYIRWFEDTDQKKPYFSNVPAMPQLKSREAQLEYLTERGLYIASACNKLIRRSVLNELSFRKGVYSEDVEWCARLMQKAESMDFVCENFYLYRQRATSIRHTINEKKCMDLANNILSCFALAEIADTETKAALLRYTAFQYGTFFAVQAKSEKVPVDSIEKLEQYSWVLKYYGNKKKLRILYLGCKLLGYKRLCGVIRLLYRK